MCSSLTYFVGEDDICVVLLLEEEGVHKSKKKNI